MVHAQKAMEVACQRLAAYVDTAYSSASRWGIWPL